MVPEPRRVGVAALLGSVTVAGIAVRIPDTTYGVVPLVELDAEQFSLPIAA
jgi:hypothetical protein